MPVIDVDKARKWAKERWPSPVVRRQVDDLLTNCPRAKEIPKITCGKCICSSSVPIRIFKGYRLLFCAKHSAAVYDDSTCDDAKEREETP